MRAKNTVQLTFFYVITVNGCEAVFGLKSTATARVHPVHLMNVACSTWWPPSGTDLWTKPISLSQ